MIVRVTIIDTRHKTEVQEYEIHSKYMAKVNTILSKQWQKTQDELNRRKEATQ